MDKIEKILRECRKAGNPHDSIVQPEFSEREDEIIAQAAQAIRDEVKRMVPEKEEHSPDCLYTKESRYKNNPTKEKYCDCGAFEFNSAIDLMNERLTKGGGE